ncbi:CAP domain-containing protein [Streptomyces sp. HU2014]|uniref:CAP domain-containing protein n=1 Tax=Streptomyces sp. HU2014 TaxID=2939414 RepID=UPI00200D2B96|nr:CAP domain-containing protein [Streptomyces sp. HU2014]UQI48447.1 CAP domain-containing protein [Streptomyces sp. HU2014]
MNHEPTTSTPDRSRRRRSKRPRRAAVVTGAVALIAIAGGGYGVAQSLGGGGGESDRAAGSTSVQAADRAPGQPGVPTPDGSAPASSAPSSASPSASKAADKKPGEKASDKPAKTDGKSDGKAGGDAGTEAKSKPDTTSDTTTTGSASKADTPAGAKPARRAPAAAAPAGGGGGKNGSHVQQVVDMVNAERAKHGCSAVTVNAKLTAAAQGHSDDMAARDYYAHTSPEGKGPGDRITAAGYRWSTYGENIFKSPKDARTAMDGWMKSQGHRDNILNCSFKEIGVGINFSANGPWWTQNFGASS